MVAMGGRGKKHVTKILFPTRPDMPLRDPVRAIQPSVYIFVTSNASYVNVVRGHLPQQIVPVTEFVNLDPCLAMGDR